MKSYSTAVFYLLFTLFSFLSTTALQAQVNPPKDDLETTMMKELNISEATARRALKSLQGKDKKGKNGPLAKAGMDLAILYASYVEQIEKENKRKFSPPKGIVQERTIYQNSIVVDAIASGNPQNLHSDLKQLGLHNSAIFKNVISGRLPIARIADAAALGNLRSVKAARYYQPSINIHSTNTSINHRSRSGITQKLIGNTTSQANTALTAESARNNYGVDGSGVKIGVLSDTYDQSGSAATTASEDIASGDLPGPGNPLGYTTPIEVLEEDAGGVDEGRAMLQLIHDIAPGASLSFHTATTGQANFAQAILELAADTAAGADVIVDDIGYLTEPFYQDGIIAQAVDSAVTTHNIVYYSSAGNQGNQSYTNSFSRADTIFAIDSTYQWIAHDFDLGPAVDNYLTINVPANTLNTFVLQWDQPYPSAGGPVPNNDLDLIVFSPDTTLISSSSSMLDNPNGHDPTEIVQLPGGAGGQEYLIAVGKYWDAGGPDPGRIKIIKMERQGSTEYTFNSAASFGHANAKHAIGVAAADYRDTPAFGQDPPLKQEFSALGGIPILFDDDGTRLAMPENRAQPRITAPDNTNTTFFGNDVDGDGFPNFAGTSAAAPHAAAVAALQLDFNTDLNPKQVEAAQQSSAIDMETPGDDRYTGAGLIQAERSLANSNGSSNIYYVDNNAGNDANSGTSWSESLATLQTAISKADGNDQIWIAEGTYKPTTGTDRAVSFSITGIKDGLEIYGGFENGDTFSQRSIMDHPVILSGDIGTTGDNSDNSYNVLSLDGQLYDITTATHLEGVTVTSGNANGSGFHEKRGGGILNLGASGGVSSPTITNVTLSGNHAIFGGALYNSGSGGQSSPIIYNSIFINNSAETDGGAVFNDGRTSGESSPAITNAVFINNTSTNGSGGAFYNNGQDGISSPVITNTTLAGNTSGANGGAITNDVTAGGNGTVEPSITNTILYGNVAGTGGEQIYNRGSGVIATLSHTLVEAGTSGITNDNGSTITYKDAAGSNVSFTQSSNLQGDPKFINNADPDGADDTFLTSDDGLDLQATSPAIDIGNNDVADLTNTDVTNSSRILGTTVDLGAYEGPLTVQITGNEGWRMMTAPSDNMSYATLLDSLWLQGMAGGDISNGTANLYTWDESSQKFQPVSDASKTPSAGQGFIAYVFSDDNHDGTDDGFPKTLPISQARNSGAVSADLSYSDSGSANDGFNLIGNPYGVTIDWNASNGWTKTNLQPAMYIWNSTAGEYQSLNGAGESTLPNGGLIAPWQGFWVQANAANPALTFTDDVKTTGGNFLKESKQKQHPQIKFELKGSDLSSKAIVVFNEQASAGKDPLDTWKLKPLSRDKLSLYTTGTGRQAFDINALPLDLASPLKINLDFRKSGLGRQYTLHWNPSSLPSNMSVILKDNNTGRILSLNKAGEYTFNVDGRNSNGESHQNSESVDISQPEHGPIPTVLQDKVKNPRFVLRVNPNRQSLAGIPKSVELNQNYPNPFNPATIIRYGVPQQAQVQLNVYDILGRKVQTLINEQKSPGRYESRFSGQSLASGLYFYRLKIGAKIITKKMTLIK